MATAKQVKAAKRNVRKAQKAAEKKRTTAHLPAAKRKELAKQAEAGRSRGGRAGHALEDRNRQQLYETARELDIDGRSRMASGSWSTRSARRGQP